MEEQEAAHNESEDDADHCHKHQTAVVGHEILKYELLGCGVPRLGGRIDEGSMTNALRFDNIQYEPGKHNGPIGAH